jgi:hypothetical protein
MDSRRKCMDFKPTAGEIANLWNLIIGKQAHLCLLEHWLYHVEDPDIKAILLHCKEDAQKIVQQSSDLYTRAGFPAPIGFSVGKDVVVKAPVLMTDKLVLVLLQILSEYGIYGYGLSVGKIKTPEVLSFFKKCLNDAADLYQSITELAQKLGYNHQPVFIPPPKHAEIANKQSYLSGWWGQQRPVNAMEVDNLIFSLRGVILAKSMFMAFSQIARDNKVKKFLERGEEICTKRIERLQTLNSSENIPFQATYETEVSSTTNAPFSDKLLMFEALSLAQIAIARYGNALSSVIRRDLSTMFAMYIVETGTFLDDGISLMIEKQWFEQPPLAVNR